MKLVGMEFDGRSPLQSSLFQWPIGPLKIRPDSGPGPGLKGKRLSAKAFFSLSRMAQHNQLGIIPIHPESPVSLATIGWQNPDDRQGLSSLHIDPSPSHMCQSPSLIAAARFFRNRPFDPSNRFGMFQRLFAGPTVLQLSKCRETGCRSVPIPSPPPVAAIAVATANDLARIL
jgi:hypothetical protein